MQPGIHCHMDGIGAGSRSSRHSLVGGASLLARLPDGGQQFAGFGFGHAHHP